MQGARCQALGVWDIKSVGEKAEDDVMIITDQNQDQNWTQLSVCHSGLPSLPPSLPRPWGTANYLGNKTDGTRDRTMHQSVIHLAEHSYPHMLLSRQRYKLHFMAQFWNIGLFMKYSLWNICRDGWDTALFKLYINNVGL